MSSQYITEPPPTASVLIHTTAGPLTISIFAQQVPLTARNFLQHCLDGYYDGTLFHRVASGFVIQTGDPTGTGEGGQSIYEDREFECYDKDWANVMKRDVEGERIEFGDEIHSRLKFNRRGLVGLAKGTGQGDGYGSQFFITLGDCRAQLDGKCTMFGRVEGDGIYNVVKIAEGECIEGTERPMYPEKILSVEILEMPSGVAWQKMTKRIKVATRTVEDDKPKKKTTSTKKKGGKALLSFGGDEGEDGESVVVRPKKAKFNTSLINGHDEVENQKEKPKKSQSAASTVESTRNKSPSPSRPSKRKAIPEPESTMIQHGQSPPSPKRRKPSFHEPTTQLPLRDPESPSRSPSSRSTSSPPPSRLRRASSSTQPTTSSLQAEIAALKQSMRRDGGSAVADSKTKPKSALEALIPSTSTRGRKRPRPGTTQSNDKDERNTMKSLDAFRARLENAADSETSVPKSSFENRKSKKRASSPAQLEQKAQEQEAVDEDDEDDEARLCDLHFIANCQSCFAADELDNNAQASAEKDNNDRSFLGHALSFEKDRLGKDLTWKKKNEEDLVVIDPRERERELNTGKKDRDRDRDRPRAGKNSDRNRKR